MTSVELFLLATTGLIQHMALQLFFGKPNLSAKEAENKKLLQKWANMFNF